MFKKLFLVPTMSLLMLVAACANMSTPVGSPGTMSPLQVVLDACQTYQQVLNDLATQRKLGNLSDNTIDVVTQSIQHVRPVCTAAVEDVPLDVRSALKVLEDELETLATLNVVDNNVFDCEGAGLNCGRPRTVIGEDL